MIERRHALVTGASGQLGSCICRLLASKDCRLSLCSLDGNGLEELVRSLPPDGRARTTTTIVDVRDAAALVAWIEACGEAQPIDWVVVNAGLGGQVKPEEVIEPAPRSADVVNVNLLGALNVIHAALPELRRGTDPRFVLISSLSALIGFDKAPVYAATKAAIRVLGLSLRPALADQGIGLTIACPGFLGRPMATGSHGWRPFSIDAEAAAKTIVAAAEAGRAQISFPLAMAAVVRALSMMPIAMRERVYRRLSR